MLKRRILIISLALALVLGLSGGTIAKIVMAADDDSARAALPTDISEGERIAIQDCVQSGMSPSEIREMFPRPAEEIEAIVHRVQKVPICIDGVWYEPEEISLFNGQELFFGVPNDGRFYAFTDLRALEEFLQKDRLERLLREGGEIPVN